MAAPRRRTERSESAAERARKAPRPTDSLHTFTPRRAPVLRAAVRKKQARQNSAPKSVGGAKNGFIMRFFALQPFL